MRVNELLARVDARAARLWLPGLLRSTARAESPDPTRPVHLYFCVADHFEPRWRRPDLETEHARVRRWETDYPRLASRHSDSFGRAPLRTLFFPEEEYRPEHLEALGRLRDAGLVDVEVHLHHDHDTEENLRASLLRFTRTLHERHGMLRPDGRGGLRWAFIHGNWALDNAHGDGRFCGVNNELAVLRETGCEVDMTMPCVPSAAQGRVVNQIYYARGTPGAPRGYDRGREVYVGGAEHPGEIMLIPGPLGLLWHSRAKGVFPRIEAAMLEPESPVDLQERLRVWVANAPAVRGAPNHRFIKLHAHGCNGEAPSYFLDRDGPFDRLLTLLEQGWSDTRRYLLHYVSAWELFETVKALEAGRIEN
jgi:hypothetical protein